MASPAPLAALGIRPAPQAPAGPQEQRDEPHVDAARDHVLDRPGVRDVRAAGRRLRDGLLGLGSTPLMPADASVSSPFPMNAHGRMSEMTSHVGSEGRPRSFIAKPLLGVASRPLA